MRGTLGGDAVLPCLFRDENKYSVTEGSVQSSSVLCLLWNSLFSDKRILASLGKNLLILAVRRSSKTWPQPTLTQGNKNQLKIKMLPKHCMPLVEGGCSRSVQSPVLLWFLSRFWSKMSPFQFCKLKRFVVTWSTLCVQSNVKHYALGKLLFGLFFLNCAAVNWKWKQDSEGVWASFVEGGKGRSVPPCSLLYL